MTLTFRDTDLKVNKVTEMTFTKVISNLEVWAHPLNSNLKLKLLKN